MEQGICVVFLDFWLVRNGYCQDHGRWVASANAQNWLVSLITSISYILLYVIVQVYAWQSCKMFLAKDMNNIRQSLSETYSRVETRGWKKQTNAFQVFKHRSGQKLLYFFTVIAFEYWYQWDKTSHNSGCHKLNSRYLLLALCFFNSSGLPKNSRQL